MNQTSLNYIKKIAMYHVDKCSCSYTDLGHLAVPTANITAIAVAIYTATFSSTAVQQYIAVMLTSHTPVHSTSCDVCNTAKKFEVARTGYCQGNLTLRQNTMVPPYFKSSVIFVL